MPNVLTGTFSATGQSATFWPKVSARATNSGLFNLSLSGAGAAVIDLEVTFDNAVTWHKLYAGGIQLNSYTYAGVNLSEVLSCIEQGVGYRLNCTAFTSAVNYRLSQS